MLTQYPEFSESIKFLRINIHNKLTWNEQIEFISKLVSRVIFIQRADLARCSRSICKINLLCLYLITHQIWTNSRKINNILTMQNKTTRAMT